MQWQNVRSSMAHSVYYDFGDLYIRYRDRKGKVTATVHYPNVDLDLWLAFLSAPSKGKFIHAYIYHRKDFFYL